MPRPLGPPGATPSAAPRGFRNPGAAANSRHAPRPQVQQLLQARLASLQAMAADSEEAARATSALLSRLAVVRSLAPGFRRPSTALNERARLPLHTGLSVRRFWWMDYQGELAVVGSPAGRQRLEAELENLPKQRDCHGPGPLKLYCPGAGAPGTAGEGLLAAPFGVDDGARLARAQPATRMGAGGTSLWAVVSYMLFHRTGTPDADPEHLKRVTLAHIMRYYTSRSGRGAKFQSALHVPVDRYVGELNDGTRCAELFTLMWIADLYRVQVRAAPAAAAAARARPLSFGLVRGLPLTRPVVAAAAQVCVWVSHAVAGAGATPQLLLVGPFSARNKPVSGLAYNIALMDGGGVFCATRRAGPGGVTWSEQAPSVREFDVEVGNSMQRSFKPRLRSGGGGDDIGSGSGSGGEPNAKRSKTKG